MTQDLPLPPPSDAAAVLTEPLPDAVIDAPATAPAPIADETLAVVSTDTALIELSTGKTEPLHFAIDGMLYDLKDWDHLNELDEARLSVLVQRVQKLYQRIEKLIEQDQNEQAEALSIKARDLRVAICVLMTTAPEATIRRLPNSAQQRIVSEAVKTIGQGQTAPAAARAE